MPAPKSANGVELRARIWRRSPRALPIAALAISIALIFVLLWIALAGDPDDAAQIARVDLDRSRADPSELLRRSGNVEDELPFFDNYATPNDGPVQAPVTPAETPASPQNEPAFEVSEDTRSRIANTRHPELLIAGPYGPLPIIADNGLTSANAYARKFTPPTGTQPAGFIAILIGGMGLSQSATINAIDKLPPDVSLSFAPYSRNLREWVARSRKAGHEIALELPLEPFNYPDNDPGPYTLLTSSSQDENLDRLSWLLSRTTEYAFVTNYQGAKFTSQSDEMTLLLQSLAERGLLYVDNGGSPRSVSHDVAEAVGLPTITGDKIIDSMRSAENIDAALAELEDIAREQGFALGIGSAFPLTVDRIENWSATLKEKNLMLVPVTAFERLRKNS